MTDLQPTFTKTRTILVSAILVAVLAIQVWFFKAWLASLDELARNDADRRVLQMSGAIATFLPVIAVSMFVHELGHLLFACAMRFSPRAFAIGPFALVRNERGVPTIAHVPTGPGGFVFAIPRDLVSLRERYAWFVAGGPIFTALLMIAALVCCALAVSPIVQAFALSTAFVNAALLIGCLIPRTVLGWRTDGGFLLDLHRDDVAWKRLKLQLAVAAWQRAGRPPSEWDESIVRDALEPANDGSHDAFAYYLDAFVARAKGDPERSAAMFAHAHGVRSELPPNARCLVIFEAMADATRRTPVNLSDMAMALSDLERASRGLDPALPHLGRALLAGARGQFDVARSALDEAKRLYEGSARTSPNRAWAEWHRAGLDQWLATMEHSRAQPRESPQA